MPNIKNADGSEVMRNGAYHEGVLYINKDSTSPLSEVVKHEFTHSIENTKSYGKLANYIFKSIASDPELAKRYGDIDSRYQDTAELYAGDVNLATADASTKAKLNSVISTEMVAQYISEELFTNPRQIDRIVRASKGFGGKILNYIQSGIERLKKGKLTAEEKSVKTFLTKAENLYVKAMQKSKPQQKQNTVQADGEERDVQFDKVKPFDQQVDEVASGNHDPNYDLYIGESFSSLSEAGLPEQPVLMRSAKINELLGKHDEMTLEIIKAIPPALNNAILIIPSKSHPKESVVVITDILTSKGNVVLPVWVNIKGKYHDVDIKKTITVNYNFVASAYGRNIKGLVEYSMEAGKLFYVGDIEKASKLLNTHGLQLSALPQVTRFNNSIPNTSNKSNQIDENSLKKVQKVINDSRSKGKEPQNTAKDTPNPTKTDGIKFSLKKDDKGRPYVKASRQVLQGDIPYLWENQTEYYINQIIRQNKNATIKTIEGDELTLTANTAGKAKYWDAKLSKEGYKTKLNAEVHIDEIAKISRADRDSKGNKIIKEDIDKKHQERDLAKDGWSYRTAMFEDFDGQRYMIKVSVAIDNDIKSVYNVGKIKKLYSPNSWVTESHVNTTSNNSIPNSGNKSNQTDENSLKKVQKVINDSRSKGKEPQNTAKDTPNSTKTDGVESVGQRDKNSIDLENKIKYTKSVRSAIWNKLAKQEQAMLYERLDHMHHLGNTETKLPNGQYLIDIKNKVIVTDGKFRSPSIECIVELNERSEKISEARDYLYEKTINGRTIREGVGIVNAMYKEEVAILHGNNASTQNSRQPRQGRNNIEATTDSQRDGGRAGGNSQDGSAIKSSLSRVATPGKVSKIPQKAFGASIKSVLKDIYVDAEHNTAVLSNKQLDKYTKYITENTVNRMYCRA